MSLRDLIESDQNTLFYNPDEFAETGTYISRTEGTKAGIVVVKSVPEGGANDHKHTQNEEQIAHIRIRASMTLGVLRPQLGDCLDLVDNGQSVRWSLMKNGIVSHKQGEFVLKFYTGSTAKMGHSQPNRS